MSEKIPEGRLINQDQIHRNWDYDHYILNSEIAARIMDLV